MNLLIVKDITALFVISTPCRALIPLAEAVEPAMTARPSNGSTTRSLNGSIPLCTLLLALDDAPMTEILSIGRVLIPGRKTLYATLSRYRENPDVALDTGVAARVRV